MKYDYTQPYVTRDEYLEVKGVDLNIELQDDDNVSNKVNRFIRDLTNFVMDLLAMDYGCNELNRQTHNFEDLEEFRRKRFHYGMLDEIEYVLNNGLIHLDSGINRETGTIMDFASIVIGPGAFKQFRLGGFCNKQEGTKYSTELSPRDYTIGELVLALANKVDKVDGKGLSTNDFTNAYKMLVDSLNRDIQNKVDKEVGKVLSDNNFTNALMSKLMGIQAGAQINKIEEIRVNNEPVTISGKVVNLTAFTHDDTKEDVANKVTTITSESTDAQYPTAKCVYDNLQTVLEVALGSTQAYAIDPTTTGNEAFQSGNANITATSFIDVKGNTINVSDLKMGTIVFTLNGENAKYVDRWLIDATTGSWGLIDADTPDLTNYASLSGNNAFTGNNTHSGTETFSNGIELDKEGTSGNSKWHIEEDNYGRLSISRTYNNTKAAYWNFDGSSLLPNSNNFNVIGSSNRYINEFYVNLLNKNTSRYGLTLPNTTNFTENSELLDSVSEQTLKGKKTWQVTSEALGTYSVSIDGSGLQAKHVNSAGTFESSTRYASGLIVTKQTGGNTHQIMIPFGVDGTMATTTVLGTPFDEHSTYVVGDIRVYLNKLWRCNTDISVASSFNSAYWDEIKIGNDFATSDQAFNVINASEMTDSTHFTEAQMTLITNGKPTRVNGNVFGMVNPEIKVPRLISGYWRGMITGMRDNTNNPCVLSYYINATTRELTVNLNPGIEVGNKALPNYPFNPTIPQSFNFLTNNTLAYEKVTKYNNLYEYDTNSTTELKYETINNITLSADTTYTLATAPTGTYPEYKGYITNSSGSAKVITLPTSVTKIKASSTLTVTQPTIVSGEVTVAGTVSIPDGAYVELSIQNGLCLLVDWNEQ